MRNIYLYSFLAKIQLFFEIDKNGISLDYGGTFGVTYKKTLGGDAQSMLL